MDFDENFRIFQKWTKLEITTFSCQSGSPSGEYSGFSYPEYPNSTTYWWILIKNFWTCQKWTKLQITRFFLICRLRGPVSGKYSGLWIRNVQTQTLLVDFNENFRPFLKWNKLLVEFFFLCIRSTGSVSGEYSGFVIRNAQN